MRTLIIVPLLLGTLNIFGQIRKERTETGNIIEYRKNIKVKEWITGPDGRYHLYEYYSSGQVKRITPFNKYEKFEGEGWIYHPNGKVKRYGQFANGKMKLVKGYDEEGNLKFVGENLNTANLPKVLENGDWTYYYSNGKLKEQVSRVDGKPCGARSLFYKDGKVKKELKYNDCL